MVKNISTLLLVSGLTLFFLTGCIRDETIRYASYDGPEKPANRTIEVFDQGSLKRPYKILALLTAKTDPGVSGQDVLNKFRNNALQMGGDALLEFGVDAPETLTTTNGTINSPRYHAKVIIFTDSK